MKRVIRQVPLWIIAAVVATVFIYLMVVAPIVMLILLAAMLAASVGFYELMRAWRLVTQE